MPDDSENTELVRKILASQYLAVLASAKNNRPYTSLVAFASTEDLKSIFFVTGRYTRKYLNIEANENVSLLIDSRSSYPSDLSVAIALTVIGKVEEVEETGRAGYVAIYLLKHPGLEHFVNSSDSAFMKVIVSDYIIAGFDKTRHLAVA